MLPHLVEECTKYLWSDLYPKNACRAYEFAKLFEEPILMDKCLFVSRLETNVFKIFSILFSLRLFVIRRKKFSLIAVLMMQNSVQYLRFSTKKSLLSIRSQSFSPPFPDMLHVTTKVQVRKYLDQRVQVIVLTLYLLDLLLLHFFT